MGEELLPSKYNDILSIRWEKIKKSEKADICGDVEELHAHV